MSKLIGLDSELKKLAAIAPGGYAIGLHVRFASPMISLNTYPASWQDHYTANVYALRDPLVAWGYAKKGTVRWSEINIPDPFNIMGQARDHGLIYGVGFSCGPLLSRTIGGCSRDDREFNDDEIKRIGEIMQFLHDKSEPPESLTKAQKEALQLIAAGHRHAEAAARLGISESALKVRLSAARNRLLARTTAEAIQRAKDFRLL